MGNWESSVSQARSYQEIGDFWDTHDLADYWDRTEAVEFEVDVRSEVRYFRLESTLAASVAKIAWQRGVSVETLLNLWVQEKLQEIALRRSTKPIPCRRGRDKPPPRKLPG
jgi:hypothetical protein